MNLLTEAMNGLGAVLLQAVALLLLEELTCGGLVRLLFARRPGAGRRGGSREDATLRERGREEHKNRKEGRQCLR